MNRRKLSLSCLFITLACGITFFAAPAIASHGQMRVTIGWLSLMEFFTPTLILGVALIIYFGHQARVA